MTDMIVKLYGHGMESKQKELAETGIQIKQALAIDKAEITKFIDENFNDICPGWVDECASSLMRHPTACFIAVADREVIGFCCYDGTAKGMVGPVGVNKEWRGKGIATELLFQTFEAMRYVGYAYAIIGWVSSVEYYQNACGAVALDNTFPGIYSRMIGQD